MPGMQGGVRRDWPGTRRVPARLDIVRRRRRWWRQCRQHCVGGHAAHSSTWVRDGLRVAGGEGPHRQQGRAPHHAPVHSLTLPRSVAPHAHGRRVGAHRGRGRARTPEGIATELSRQSSPRLYRAHNAEGRAPRPGRGRGNYLDQACGRWCRRASARPRGERIYEDLPLSLRALRDLMRRDIEKVRVDSRETSSASAASRGSSCPSWPSASSTIPASSPIFDLYGVGMRSSAPCKGRCRSNPAATW